jgi:uncharacterized protein (DUF1015 family)
MRKRVPVSMVSIFRFSAVRPAPSHAQGIAAVPYDVVSAEEARECIRKNRESFLRVSRSDALLPDRSPYDQGVYDLAKENFQRMIQDGQMVQDDSPSFYLYRVTEGSSCYLGLACGLGVEDYKENHIKRHEATRYDKEEDRTRHIDVVNAHTGPVVLLYNDPGDIYSYIESLVSNGQKPVSSVKREQGGLHEIFRISDDTAYDRIQELFRGIDTYIADGHHRAKSAVNVAEKRKAEGRFSEEAGHFMGVLFSHRRVAIHGYSRLVTQQKKMPPETLLGKIGQTFEVTSITGVDPTAYQILTRDLYLTPHHVFHMYQNGIWYECAIPYEEDAGPIETLDVSVLQKLVLEKLLGITDPRGDMRLQYLGGARPVGDLEELVDRGDFMAAFSMQPVDVNTVLSIADAGCIMPPKSTWFEPKLLSGLLVHSLD